MKIVTRSGDTVDAICWSIFGRTAGVTEQVYDRNIGLSAHGPILPDGIIITLPEITQAAPIKRELIQLWS